MEGATFSVIQTFADDTVFEDLGPPSTSNGFIAESTVIEISGATVESSNGTFDAFSSGAFRASMGVELVITDGEFTDDEGFDLTFPTLNLTISTAGAVFGFDDTPPVGFGDLITTDFFNNRNDLAEPNLPFTPVFFGGGGNNYNVDNFDVVAVSTSVDLGDVNCDGTVNLLDVGPFVELISSGGFDPKADINQDGSVDLLDVGQFVDLLSG